MSKNRKSFMKNAYILILATIITLEVGVLRAFNIQSVNSEFKLMVCRDILIMLETTSDWTEVFFYGVRMFNYSYEVVEGSHAPGLSISITQNEIKVHKKQFDTTKVILQLKSHLIFTNNTARIEIRKGDLGYTKMTIYYYKNGEKIVIKEFVNEGSIPGNSLNPREYTLKREEVAGYIKATEFREPQPRKLVLAFYYPWYGSIYGPSKEWVHWKMVTAEDIGTSTDYPLLGAYDSQDSEVIKCHMILAKYAGIDGFIASWWGVNRFSDNAFSKVIKVAEELGFNVTIYYESVRDISKEQIVNELAYVIRKYSSSKAFLRINGKPVIFIYAIRAYGRDIDFWEDVLREVRRITNKDVMFIADSRDVSALRVFDGIHIYNPLGLILKGVNLTQFYRDQAVKTKEYFTIEKVDVISRKIFCATVLPGFDNRKNKSLQGEQGKYLPRLDGKTYKDTWEAALSSDPDIVLICTWNEWHEGTEIEPSREYGFKYLLLTREYVEKYKGIKLPELGEPKINITQISVNEVREQEGVMKKINAYLKLANVGSGPAFMIELDFKESVLSVSITKASAYVIGRTPLRIVIPILMPNEEQEISLTLTCQEGKITSVDLSYYSAQGTKYSLSKTLTEKTEEQKTEEQKKGTRYWEYVAIVAGILASLGIITLLRKIKGIF